MAYMNQERKAKLAPAIKAVCKKYGMKATIGVSNHSTLVLNIASGKLDMMKGLPATDYYQVNEYHIDAHYTGKVRDFLNEVKKAMMVGNHNNSDTMTDYFDVGWYIDINVGRYNKPYVKTV